MVAPRYAMIASILLQVAQRRFLLDREAARHWGRRFLATDQDSLESVRGVLAASDDAVARELEDLLPPSAAPIGGWQPGARLGIGPLGSTWLAHRGTELAAIKILGLDPATATARAQAQTALDLRKATHVLVPDAVIADGPALALVHRYVPGRDFAGRLRVRGPAGERRALRFARHAAKALLRIHRAGGVHADLRPGNVLFAHDGRALLSHHQLAVHGDRFAAGFEPWADGGEAWLAPELAAGGAPDERSDCYAVACALYHLMAGEPPFPGEPERQRLQHARASRPDVRQRAPGASELTAKTIARALAIDPAERFRGSEDFLRALIRASEAAPPAGPDPADDRAATLVDSGSARIEAPAELWADEVQDTLATALGDGPRGAEVDPALRTGATAIAEPGSATDDQLSLTDSFLLDEPD